jgi:hypothetical protein
MKYQDTIDMYLRKELGYRLFFLVLLLSVSLMSFSQSSQNKSQTIPKKVWFVSISAGVQMSGIKDEDFISKNVAPALTLGGGFWITPEIGLYAGYKGPYFNTIADDDKHYYNFIYGEILLNITEMIEPSKQRKWNLILHPGAGIFNNTYYGRPNVCFNFGMNNSYTIWQNIDLFIDLSVIAGWDIYQGDDDILPSVALGATYSFR